MFAVLAASCMLVAAVELALSALVPNTAIRNDQLPLGARISLAAYGVAVLMGGVSAVGGLLLLLSSLRRPGVHPAIHWTVRGLQGLVVFVAVLLYGTSWALFWNTGVFFDRQAFAFLVLNGLQIYHWVYPPLAVAVLIATLVSSAVLGWWVPRWTSARRPAVRRKLVLAAGGAFGICVVAALAGRIAYASEMVQGEQPKTDYAVSRDDQAGPAAHAFADIARGSGAEAPAVASTGNANVIRRPIIAMDQYLAGVQQNGIKRWNVVMVQIESLRSDQLRLYGGTRDVMPTIDARIPRVHECVHPGKPFQLR
jgi:glucan phosphoethanolaminetransferase (alkaline phosphatase superfamily)